MELLEHLRLAAWLKEQNLTVRPLWVLEGETQQGALSQLAALDGSVLTARDGAACRAAGVTDLFFPCTGQTDEALATAFGSCCYVIGNKAEMQQVDRVVGPLLRPGYLENIAIRLSPAGAEVDGFTTENIEQFGRWLRFSENLAVRGIFLDLTGAEDLNVAAKEAFSLVKKIRSDLPCLFYSFCLKGLLAPLARGDAELLQTVRMLASLNDTSLYANFFIA